MAFNHGSSHAWLMRIGITTFRSVTEAPRTLEVQHALSLSGGSMYS